MSQSEIYDQCLTAHAHRWIESYRTLPHIVYLEFHAGPILARYMERYGLKKVLREFKVKTASER